MITLAVVRVARLCKNYRRPIPPHWESCRERLVKAISQTEEGRQIIQREANRVADLQQELLEKEPRPAEDQIEEEKPEYDPKRRKNKSLKSSVGRGKRRRTRGNAKPKGSIEEQSGARTEGVERVLAMHYVS